MFHKLPFKSLIAATWLPIQTRAGRGRIVALQHDLGGAEISLNPPIVLLPEDNARSAIN